MKLMVPDDEMVAQNMMRTYDVTQFFSGFFFGFDDSFDVTERLQQIEIPYSLHMCTPSSELPSNKSTNDNFLSFHAQAAEKFKDFTSKPVL